MQEILTASGLISLLTLTLMEVVLGIDNIIFISILTGRLPEHQQKTARFIGLALALIIRIALLFGITWLIGLNKTLFTVFDHEFTGRDLILMLGGLFLIYKSTVEIHEKLEGSEKEAGSIKTLTMNTAIFQIVLLDVVFSFDSILTAVGLVDSVLVMVIAVVIAMIIMIISANSISDFVNRHPTVKMLALAFLLLIGILLMVEGFHFHIPKGYVYFAMFFSLFVELLNLRAKRKKRDPVILRQKYKQTEN
jgi:predicted tellurium resistance membrane protein TerC